VHQLCGGHLPKLDGSFRVHQLFFWLVRDNNGSDFVWKCLPDWHLFSILGSNQLEHLQELRQWHICCNFKCFCMRKLRRWNLLGDHGRICMCKLRRGHLYIFFSLYCLCKLCIGHFLGVRWWQQL